MIILLYYMMIIHSPKMITATKIKTTTAIEMRIIEMIIKSGSKSNSFVVEVIFVVHLVVDGFIVEGP